MTDTDRLDAPERIDLTDGGPPLTDYEIDAIRNRDANAKNPARTWAVADRRVLLLTLDARDATIRSLVAAARERDELRAAGEAVVDWLGECDHFDHHGNCQTHAIERPCRVAALRAALHREDGA